MKVYYQAGAIKAIRPIRGDLIAEINIMKAIDQFAEVYYSGQRFKSNLEGYGLTEYPGSIEERALADDYDLYYVRNNPYIFPSLPEPKIFVASPYFENCFNAATHLSVPTRTWADMLINGEKIGPFPPMQYKNAVAVHQTIDPSFKPLQDHPRTKQIRSELGGEHIIGCFGAIRESCFPYSFLNILPKLMDMLPGLTVVFNDVTDMQGQPVLEKEYPYEDMPYVLSACDLVLYNVRITDGNVAGSLKVIEAMATGTPVLCPKFDARVEELGPDYELFHPYEDSEESGGRFSEDIEDIMLGKIIRGLTDIDLRNKLRKELPERAMFYSIEESSKRLEKLFTAIVEGRHVQ